jgi:hypothetical protein
MPERVERRRLFVAWSIVLGAAIAHRLILFLLHRHDLEALTAANQVCYIFQYLPREMLRDHLAPAMLLLQQTPPVPNLLMGLALKGFSWPGGVAQVLIGLQSLASILTAGVLVHLLSVLYPRRVVLWTVLGLLFVVNTDLVVIEYDVIGQIVYEPLSMLGVLTILDALVCLRRTGRLRWAVVAGIAMGLLVLTRATWYVFPIPCLLLVAMLAPMRRVAAVLACLVPILVLQGGWAVKNYAVYGVLSPTTSTWGGLHAMAGLRSSGFVEKFTEWRAGERGAPSTASPSPQEISDRDAEVQRSLGLTNPALNTLGWRIALAKDQRDFFHFVLAHPGTMLRKCWMAYHIFWQPIAYHASQFVALFAVSNRITNPFDPAGIVRQLLAGSLPDVHYLASGSHPFVSLDPKDKPLPYRYVPTDLYTWRRFEPFGLMIELVGVHLLLPLVGVLWVADRVRHGWSAAPRFDPLRMAALLVATTLYGYLAFTANLIETHENMRYRLEVEPVIWVITLVCFTELARLLRARREPAGLASLPAR